MDPADRDSRVGIISGNSGEKNWIDLVMLLVCLSLFDMFLISLKIKHIIISINNNRYWAKKASNAGSSNWTQFLLLVKHIRSSSMVNCIKIFIYCWTLSLACLFNQQTIPKTYLNIAIMTIILLTCHILELCLESSQPLSSSFHSPVGSSSLVYREGFHQPRHTLPLSARWFCSVCAVLSEGQETSWNVNILKFYSLPKN